MYADRCGITCRQYHVEGSGKETNTRDNNMEIQRIWNLKCMVIPEIIGATGMVVKVLKKNLEAIPGKLSVDSLHKGSYTRNITRNSEMTAVRNRRRERWGPLLVQRKYQEEKASDRRQK